jgi:hypothetical protein
VLLVLSVTLTHSTSARRAGGAVACGSTDFCKKYSTSSTAIAVTATELTQLQSHVRTHAASKHTSTISTYFKEYLEHVKRSIAPLYTAPHTTATHTSSTHHNTYVHACKQNHSLTMTLSLTWHNSPRYIVTAIIVTATVVTVPALPANGCQRSGEVPGSTAPAFGYFLGATATTITVKFGQW